MSRVCVRIRGQLQEDVKQELISVCANQDLQVYNERARGIAAKHACMGMRQLAGGCPGTADH